MTETPALPAETPFRAESAPDPAGLDVLSDVLGVFRLAASYAQLGRKEEAAQATAEILRLKPDFSILGQSPATWGHVDLAHLREGMRKAGLPD